MLESGPNPATQILLYDVQEGQVDLFGGGGESSWSQKKTDVGRLAYPETGGSLSSLMTVMPIKLIIIKFKEF